MWYKKTAHDFNLLQSFKHTTVEMGGFWFLSRKLSGRQALAPRARAEGLYDLISSYNLTIFV